ncbi:hypothetical protein ACJMK2_029368 [Sinanodonta woodiana]|uniref:RING-type domain-containing protein n=1 Tax=Sinanodonta woodiana TaxID=1069815 RepID=A0ABD3XDT4_SINWO
MQYYAIVSIDLKRACKNERSVLILDRLKGFDCGILILEKYLEAVKVITSATRYYNELLGIARETHLTLNKLLARPVKNRSICVIKEGKVSIYEGCACDLYENAMEMEFSLYAELNVSGNQLEPRRCKTYLKYLSRIRKTKADVIEPKPADRTLNKVFEIYAAKIPFMVVGRMVNEDNANESKNSLQYCIDHLVQPNSPSLVEDYSGRSDPRRQDVSQSIPNLRLTTNQYPQLANSSVQTPAINSTTSQLSLQSSVTSDSWSVAQRESITSQNFSEVRLQLESRVTEASSNVTDLCEGCDTESVQRPQHPFFEEYTKRISSYATWQKFALFDKDSLARAGLFNTGKGTTVRCFFCGIELANLSPNNDPLLEHVRKSSSCGYLRRELEPRRIAEYQERIRNENSLSHDRNVQGSSTATSRNPGRWNESDRIRNPHYQSYSIRLSSFARWPSDITQRPEQVADAGFYYTGLQDVVRCFACDGGLKNWDPEDEPWIEHARWFPQCPFVKRVKGQEFIDIVRRMTEESDEDEDAVVHSTFQPSNPMADAPTLENELNPHPEAARSENVLETDTAKCVLDMGYSKEIVARTINELLSKGKLDYTAKDIMEIILEKEDEVTTEAHGHKPLSSTPGTSTSTQRNDPVQRLIQENERLRQSMKCVECRVAARDILLLPCTHLCLCSNCSSKAAICPLCYTKIREKIKTYVI